MNITHACPDPALHRIADAPLRPLSDLLKAAVLYIEVVDGPQAPEEAIGQERLAARRTAARRLS